MNFKKFSNSKTSLKAAYVTRWDSNPHILGSGSGVGVHAQTFDTSALATPESEGLYFAGAHTARCERETILGAFISGKRAALEARTHLQLAKVEVKRKKRTP